MTATEMTDTERMWARHALRVVHMAWSTFRPMIARLTERNEAMHLCAQSIDRELMRLDRLIRDG